MTLGLALVRHREQCAACTADHACSGYLEIAREHTATRRLHCGPTAAHTVLSVRENPAVDGLAEAVQS